MSRRRTGNIEARHLENQRLINLNNQDRGSAFQRGNVAKKDRSHFAKGSRASIFSLPVQNPAEKKRAVQRLKAALQPAMSRSRTGHILKREVEHQSSAYLYRTRQRRGRSSSVSRPSRRTGKILARKVENQFLAELHRSRARRINR